MRHAHPLLAATALLGLACTESAPPCERCETLVIAAVGEPDHLLPPLAWSSVGRDIDDLVFERLALLDTRRSPLDETAYAPGLASAWERLDARTLRFRLRSGARWHDGTPVTAADVVHAFAAYQDPALDAIARPSLADITAEAEDSATVRLTFATERPDQFYDATWHVRVFPRHLWDTIPRAEWGSRADASRLVGSGAYRVASWTRGQSLTLTATDSTAGRIRTIAWRFTTDPTTTTALVQSGEADIVETLVDPTVRAGLAGDSAVQLLDYPSAQYGYLGFQLRGSTPLADAAVRRALTRALDRQTLVTALLGPRTQVPPGPHSAQLWLWEGADTSARDTVMAARLLDEAGYRRGSDGVRVKHGTPLEVAIMVPATSTVRRNLAIAIEQQWAALGVRTVIDVVEFPVFQERLGTGRFESYIGAWLDEPHPRSLADSWTSGGIANAGGYANPAFDAAFRAAMTTRDTATVRRHWREAMRILNDDAPAIWLYAAANTAVASRRLQAPTFTPFAWLAGAAGWRKEDR